MNSLIYGQKHFSLKVQQDRHLYDNILAHSDVSKL